MLCKTLPIQDSGCEILDTGFWIRDSGSWILDSESIVILSLLETTVPPPLLRDRPRRRCHTSEPERRRYPVDLFSAWQLVIEVLKGDI